MTTVVQVSNPKGYRGLYRFHKYWGKKPFEPIAFIIESLTDQDEVVLDPFVGSGIAAREAARIGRRFIGIDLNPIAVQLSKFLVSPPTVDVVREGLEEIKKQVREDIEASYTRIDENMVAMDYLWDTKVDRRLVATHYLWDNGTLREIWRAKRGSKRKVYEPTNHDISQFKKYENYQPRHIRLPKFFDNSRINTSTDLHLNDLVTGRALRNIDLLIEAIRALPLSVQPVFELCLTASIGQMSNMVFAITGRGKTEGKEPEKIEVGSWVIGYWRPELHFEINVWSRFCIRTKRLIKALEKSPFSLPSHQLTDDPIQVLHDNARVAIVHADAFATLNQFDTNCIDLILTDPPHGDRVPYLELSEMWNAILCNNVDFEQEIVVSNAADRRKGLNQYSTDMNKFLNIAADLLKKGGFLVILFNAGKSEDWQYLHSFTHQESSKSSLEYLGHFPVPYSARSVVQDSRQGSLKDDFAMVFRKPGADDTTSDRVRNLQSLDGWSNTFPTGKGE